MTDGDDLDWQRACSSAELLPGEQRSVWLGDLALLLVNLDGQPYALEDRCSHEDFPLSDGAFDPASASIECVLHGARFDVRDGRPLCAPAYAPVRRFPARLQDGTVYVGLPRA